MFDLLNIGWRLVTASPVLSRLEIDVLFIVLLVIKLAFFVFRFRYPTKRLEDPFSSISNLLNVIHRGR